MSPEPLHATERDTDTHPDTDSGTDWIVVTQVKSFRVVYFTDDPGYAPPGEGDWYYLSPYRGALPPGMTLRNCWRWRFNGHAFVDAGVAPPRPAAELLLQQNKEALRKLLRDKIDAVRRPYAPATLMGECIRAARLDEARRLLAGMPPPAPEPGHLARSAAARGCGMHEMAQRVLDRHAAQEHMLRESEQLRESLALAIDDARTQDALIAIRTRLMEEIAPELNALFAPRPPHTTPKQHRAAPTADQLASERLRLRIQLRERINALRRPFVSHYLLDDRVLQHRGRIARAVLAAGGALPPGMDGASLVGYAAARGQALHAAARELLAEMDEAARALLDTEQMKDALLSRIAAVGSFEDIRRAAAAIAECRLTPAAVMIRADCSQGVDNNE